MTSASKKTFGDMAVVICLLYKYLKSSMGMCFQNILCSYHYHVDQESTYAYTFPEQATMQ